jgi:cytochrome c-type biogenesis protein CcmH/NrfG
LRAIANCKGLGNLKIALYQEASAVQKALKLNEQSLYITLEQGMDQNTSPKPIQRILIIISGIAFAGSTVFGMAGLFTSALQEPKDNAKTAAASRDSQLEAQERGYELVLQREPDNQVALQGLVQARLQMNDLQGAVDPLEKLVKLNPDRAEYKAQLAGIKQRVGKEGKVSDH